MENSGQMRHVGGAPSSCDKAPQWGPCQQHRAARSHYSLCSICSDALGVPGLGALFVAFAAQLLKLFLGSISDLKFSIIIEAVVT